MGQGYAKNPFVVYMDSMKYGVTFVWSHAIVSVIYICYVENSLKLQHYLLNIVSLAQPGWLEPPLM